jgi:hypothetical protein
VVGVTVRCAGRWLALAAAVVVAGCGGPATQVPGTPGGGTSVAAAPLPSPGSAVPTPAGPERALPLYFVTESAAGPRLVREFRRLPADDPGSAAVAALLAAPTGTAPGHRSAWPAGTALAAPVRHEGGVVTVDLTGEAAAGTVGPELAALTVQQLVFTVTGALGTTDPVRLLVAGEPVARLWDRVDTAAPIPRADPYSVRLLVQIDEPAEGARVTSPVRVSGEAAVFEATVLWEVRRDGAVVRSGAATSAEGQRFAPYTFSVELPPGEYEIRVSEDDPSGGAGRPVMSDARRVTVTA